MAVTISGALRASQLEAVDARALLRHMLGVGDAHLIAHSGQMLTDDQSRSFSALAARRRAGEPVAYITGLREFFSLEFKVTPAVLIPRTETELLVEFALEHIAPDAACRLLDLGTGSGCIAISIAKHRPRAEVLAVDASATALEVARRNAQRHAVANLELMHGNWFGTLAGQRFDLIVTNPPYVAAGDPHLTQGDLRFEPETALAAGADGLECLRRIVTHAPRYLKPGGWLACEHGYDQSSRCRDLLAGAGFTRIFSRADVTGIERISGGQREEES
jgi:release factor glutamine methyltransferase